MKHVAHKGVWPWKSAHGHLFLPQYLLVLTTGRHACAASTWLGETATKLLPMKTQQRLQKFLGIISRNLLLRDPFPASAKTYVKDLNIAEVTPECTTHSQPNCLQLQLEKIHEDQDTKKIWQNDYLRDVRSPISPKYARLSSSTDNPSTVARIARICKLMNKLSYIWS